MRSPTTCAASRSRAATSKRSSTASRWTWRARAIATFDELRLYCYRVASAVGLICIEIFGYRNPRTREYAENLGIAFQLTNIIRDVSEDAARGRIYLPLEDLARFGVSEDEILRGVVHARTSSA